MYSESKCFRMLGIGRHASLEDVRRAYRGLALDLHPDRPGGDEERFKEITAAYNQLVQRLNTGPGPRLRKDGSRRGKVWSTSERRADTSSSRSGGSWQRWRPDPKADVGSGRESRYRARPDVSGTGRRTNQSTNTHSTSEPNHRKTAQPGKTKQRQNSSAPFKQARRQNWTEPTRKKTTAPPPSAESEKEMNDDLASAWKAWCASARSYQDEHQPETSETEAIHRTEAQFEQPTEDGTAVDPENGGLVGWLKRGLKKLKSEPLHRVSSQDKHLRLRVNETTLLYGGKHRIAIHRDALCPSCIGDTIYGCVCGGTGRIKVRDVVSVTVPPGARSGVQLRLEGKGTAGMAGQPNGDLFLQLEPSDVRGFRRENIDLHGVFSVPTSVATGGGVVEVMLPRGEVKVHVPPGTRSGDKFRLRGLGVPAWRGQEIGDVYLSVMLN